MLLSEKDTHILIDAGISMRRIETSLREQGLTVEDIAGVLITHEHSDHISGLKMLLKHHDIEVFAPRTVGFHLRNMLPDIEDRLITLPVGAYKKLGRFKVLAFHTPHDTDESVGYRIEGEGVFAMATDMGHVSEEVLDGLYGAGTVLVESNHDVDMLCDGPYPAHLKRRILSDRGHLSNPDCAKLLRYLADNGTSRFVIGHLSRENNCPDTAMDINRKALEGTGAELYCAPIYGCLEIAVEEKLPCSL